jgi:cytoskeletal protein RodZ
MERGDLGVFGGDIYARGFLRSYARLVGVAEQHILELHGNDPAFDAPAVAAHMPLSLQRGMPSWLVGLLAVVAVAGVLAAVLLFGGRRAPDVVGAVDPGITDPGAIATDPEQVLPPQPAPLPPEPVPGPPIDLVLTFEATSWLEVLVDGVVREPGALIPAGETLRFTGQETVILRFGNAGGVRIESSGVDLGALGRSGQVLRVTFDPDGLVDGTG